MKYEIIKTSDIATVLTLEDENGKKLIVNFADNLDLTFSLRLLDENDGLAFTISRDDEQIFSIFKDFYEAITSAKVDERLSSSPVKDGVITWVDDYSPENIGESFIIEKADENTFTITFKRALGTRIKRAISVRIANSGSRYKLFTKFFMSLFKNMAELISNLPKEDVTTLEKKPN